MDAVIEARVSRPPLPVRDRFFFRTSLVMGLFVIVSFPASYFGPMVTGSKQFAPIVHLHGLAFFAWMALYVIQTNLAARGKVARHRELGMAGIALSAIMVPLGLAATIAAIHGRQAKGDPTPFAFTLYNLIDIFSFAAMVVVAIAVVTRHVEWHRRFMYAAAICLVGPAISRWFIPLPAWPPYTDFAPNIIADLFLIPLALYDRRRSGRIHPATILVAIALVPIHLITPALSLSRAWTEVAPFILRFVP